MNPLVAGIDLGGTAGRVLIWDGLGVLAARTERIGVLGAGPPEERTARLADLVAALLPAGATLAAVGIGASGPLDAAAGVIHNPDTLPQFSGLPLVADLRHRLDVPVALENDAVAAAIGEHAAGAGRGAERLLMVTLGTGIGVAFLDHGAPFRGPGGAHPEAGHIPAGTGDERCYCGLAGCWEQLASRGALQRMVRECRPHLPDGPDMLAHAAADPALAPVFARYGTRVGRGLAVLHAIFMPDVTVLGGSAAAHLELFRPSLLAELVRAPGYATPNEIRGASLGDAAGAIGAAVLARRRFILDPAPPDDSAR